MKSFWKSLLTVGALAGVGYLGFKGYQRINEVMKISKSLPDYLFDLIGEKPKIDLNMKLKSISLAIGLSSEVYENLKINLDEQIKCYINDYYPNLAKLQVNITKYIKANQLDEDEDEDD